MPHGLLESGSVSLKFCRVLHERRVLHSANGFVCLPAGVRELLHSRVRHCDQGFLAGVGRHLLHKSLALELRLHSLAGAQVSGEPGAQLLKVWDEGRALRSGLDVRRVHVCPEQLEGVGEPRVGQLGFGGHVCADLVDIGNHVEVHVFSFTTKHVGAP